MLVKEHLDTFTAACVDNFNGLWAKSQHKVLFQHVSLVYPGAVFPCLLLRPLAVE